MENKEQNTGMSFEEIIQDVLKGMEGIGGIPSKQEFYNEFDFRLRSAFGIESSQPINSGWVSLERAKKYARHQHYLGSQGQELVEFEDWEYKDSPPKQ